MTYTAPGIKQYQKHMKASKSNYKDIKVFETHIVLADYNDNKANDDLSLQPPDPVLPNSTHKVTTMDKGNGTITPFINTQGGRDQELTNNDFLLDLPHVILDESEPKTLSAQDGLIRRHLRLNHMPLKQICKMAKNGLLPKKMLKAQEPVCYVCQYSKMHHKPWRTKGRITNKA